MTTSFLTVFRMTLAMTTLGAAADLARAGEEGFDFFRPLSPPRSFEVVAHRGLAELAPENSRPALDACIQDCLEWVAVDIQLTKDGQHVLFAGATLDDKSSGGGPPREQTLAQLEQLDAGTWFAKRFAGVRLLSLDACLSLAKGKINLYLDCHSCDPRLLMEQIKRAGMERQVLVHADRDSLRHLHELSDGSLAVAPNWQPSDGLDGWLDELRPAVVEIDAAAISPEVCHDFHAHAIKVLANLSGQSDTASTWDKALADGVDFLQTDLPEELVAHVLDKQLASRPVKMACHRGASRYAPENTLPAFEKAYRLHADYVEFDVRPSSDGQYFLMHDGKLDRTTGAKGPIRGATAETIAALDAGSWFGRPFAGTHVPSLEEFLAAVPKGVTLYFDAKDIQPEDLAAALNEHDLAERTVVYQGPGFLEKLKAVDSRIRLLPPGVSMAQVTALAKTLKPYGVDTSWKMLSKEYIDHCHAEGIQVFADAPGNTDVAGYRRAIEWGIDLIQTDHPLPLLRAMELVVAERGGHASSH